MKPVAIIGGGISGLSAAYKLKKEGIPFTLFEEKPNLGGVIQTHREDDFLAEAGPNSFRIQAGGIVDEMIDELSLRDQVVELSNQAKARYVVKDKKLVPVPNGPMSFLKTSLFSIGAKLRLLKEPFIKALPTATEESVATFVKRRFGQEVLDYAVDPFVSGVYAGDPELLSLKHIMPTLHEAERQHGSVIKGMFKNRKGRAPFKVVSFINGMTQFIEALGEYLGDNVQRDYTIEQITHNGQSWQIDGAEYASIIVATPSFKLAEIPFPAEIQGLLKPLGQIKYSPIAILTQGFEGEIQDGFGMLIPECERLNILGTIFSSNVFPNRADAGHYTITSFIGGARHPKAAALPLPELRQMVRHDLSQLLGINKEPVFEDFHYWQHAIPQYEVGYGRFLEIMDNIEKSHPSLKIIGNFRGGAALGKCIENAVSGAEAVLDSVRVEG